MDIRIISSKISGIYELSSFKSIDEYEYLRFHDDIFWGYIFEVKEIMTEKLYCVEELPRKWIGMTLSKISFLSYLVCLGTSIRISFNTSDVFANDIKYVICFVMDPFESQDLDSFLKSRNHELVPEPLGMSIFEQIFNAVAYLREHNFILKWIDRSEILISNDNQIKFAQFGFDIFVSQRYSVGYCAP
jgi:serine/threonine protein kinase